MNSIHTTKSKTNIANHGEVSPLSWLAKVYRNTIAVLIFLALWEVAPRLGLVNAMFIPPFSTVVLRAIQMFASMEMIYHLVASLGRALLGFALSLLVGFPLGILLGINKKVRTYIDPLLTVLGQTSPLALFPMFIILFGIGETSKVGIIFWGGVWPILLNTISGVAHVDGSLIKAARTMGASKLTVLTKVIIPAAMPEVFPGIRISASNSILMLVAAEMLGAKNGLGYLIFHAKQSFDMPEMYAAIIVIAITGVVFSRLLSWWDRRVLFWKNK